MIPLGRIDVGIGLSLLNLLGTFAGLFRLKKIAAIRPAPDTKKIREDIEAVRRHLSSNYDDLKEDVIAISGKLRSIRAWMDRIYRFKEE